MPANRFEKFELLRSVEHRERFTKTRTIVNKIRKHLELSNSGNFHRTFDAHMDPFAGLRAVLPLNRQGLRSNFPKTQPEQREVSHLSFSSFGIPSTTSFLDMAKNGLGAKMTKSLMPQTFCTRNK
jgi:hypothetical protein